MSSTLSPHIFDSSMLHPATYIICRHGQTDFNLDKRIQGFLDVSRLTPLGENQANELGNALVDYVFTDAFVSSLARARQTLQLLSEPYLVARKERGNHDEQFPSDILEELKEVNLHEWEGLSFDEVRTSFPEGWLLWKQSPEQLRLGPTNELVVSRLYQRAQEAWLRIGETIRQRQSDSDTSHPRVVIIMSHSGMSRALLATAANFDESYFRHLTIENCGAFELVVEDVSGPVDPTIGPSVCLGPGARKMTVRKIHPFQSRSSPQSLESLFSGARGVPHGAANAATGSDASVGATLAL